MSTYNPPTLLQLALEGVLRKESIDFSDLEYLPITLFPPLFKEAFSGGRAEIVKAMVAACHSRMSFYVAFLQILDMEGIQVKSNWMEGSRACFQMQLMQRRKLQVLDLREVDQDFWDVWAGKKDGVHSAKKGRKKQVSKHVPKYALRRRLKVVTDLGLCFSLNEHQTCLLQWAKQRKESLRLCCLKMKIFAFPVEIVKEIFTIFQPNYIEELEIYTNQVLSFLGCFAPCFGQMRSLLRFHLCQMYLISGNGVIRFAEVKKCAAKFLSQFSKLKCLQHLAMNGDYFSSDHLKQLFRCLKTPLESLSVNLCQLSKSDLKHMSDCQRLYQLKHLHFRGVEFSKSGFESLRILLENVSETLKTLKFEHCRMKDSQLKVVLPALSHCSQLTRVNFYGNDFSSPVLKDLLRCMANLSKLHVEQYPASLECYDHRRHVVVEQFAQLCPDLMDIVIAKRQPKTIIFATESCPRCLKCCIYDRKTSLCLCWQ
ncbi:PRAME family member 8-like [Mus pahari]|uniref:PRAME family member 8-like n=1 Tax=Mus pahari TaxID=10093 RepID=UPI000A310A71|nr:PRAME family member 8-like [Mus pahari]